MSYTVTEATVVFPIESGLLVLERLSRLKRPCAHIDCDFEGGFERSIWIPVRVARLYVKNRPIFPVIGMTFARRCSLSNANVHSPW